MTLSARMKMCMSAAALCCGAGGFPGEAWARAPVDCIKADSSARRAYNDIREAFRTNNHASLRESKRIFWDIADYGGECSTVREMANQLRMHNLGRDSELISVRGNSSLGDTRSSRGIVNATVLAIEVMPGSRGDVGGASSAAGSAGSAGSSGASYGDRVYRVTLQMDDGSTQVVTQEAAPDFRSGDRVNLTQGIISH